MVNPDKDGVNPGDDPLHIELVGIMPGLFANRGCGHLIDPTGILEGITCGGIEGEIINFVFLFIILCLLKLIYPSLIFSFLNKPIFLSKTS